MNHHDARPADLDPDASLVEDPLLEDSRDAGSVVRGGPEWRQLSFRASGLTIELEITGSGDSRRLMGQLIPRQSAARASARCGRTVSGQVGCIPRGGYPSYCPVTPPPRMPGVPGLVGVIPDPGRASLFPGC